MVLGTRLVSLWRRTRERPELVIGASFLLAGALGYMAWLALGALLGSSAQAETVKHVAMRRRREKRASCLYAERFRLFGNESLSPGGSPISCNSWMRGAQRPRFA